MINVLTTYPLSPSARLEICQGDITKENVDAIVNAANSHLSHGGGVAGAIVRAGGWSIQEESNEWVRQHGLVEGASPAYTGAGKLAARYIIHAVGPVWGSGDEEKKLADAILGSLRLAKRLGVHSIAFPAISTGIFGFPKRLATQVFLCTFQEYYARPEQQAPEQVRMTLLDPETLALFLEESQKTLRGSNP